MAKNPHAVALGRKGGQANTDAQNAARRENAKKAGRKKGSKNKQPRKRKTPADLA